MGGLLPDRGLSARTIWVHPNVTIGSDIYDMSQKGGSVTNVTVRGQSHPNVTDLPMTRVGYARVSTIDQDLDIQVARLKVSTAEQKSAIRRRKTRPSCYMPGGVA